jgi:hypothetical protein
MSEKKTLRLKLFASFKNKELCQLSESAKTVEVVNTFLKLAQILYNCCLYLFYFSEIKFVSRSQKNRRATISYRCKYSLCQAYQSVYNGTFFELRHHECQREGVENSSGEKTSMQSILC